LRIYGTLPVGCDSRLQRRKADLEDTGSSHQLPIPAGIWLGNHRRDRWRRDGTAEKVRKFRALADGKQKISYVDRKENKGKGFTVRKGMLLATR